MNLTEKMLGLEDITSLPVEEGDYEGDAHEYITYNYADERTSDSADDEEYARKADIDINVVIAKSRDYFEMKESIWTYLKTQGFNGITFMSYVENTQSGRLRHLLFSCNYTQTMEV